MLSSDLTPKALKVILTKNLIAFINGVNANTKNLTRPATFYETPSGLVIANVLGIISEKTNIKKVIVNVAIMTPFS